MPDWDDDTRWWWSSEYGRDKMLREAIRDQYQETLMLRSSMARQAGDFQKQLRNVQGSVENRLGRLTDAFLSYVRLDGIEKDLSAFVGHPSARSQARRNIQRLIDGHTPEEVADCPNYWLPPAVAALGPDGSVDPTLAERARQRNPEATGIFLTIAQAALGRGAAVLGDLPGLLAPDEDGCWHQWQALVWSAIAMGAFGPGGLEAARGVVDDLLTGRDDWVEWLNRSLQGDPRPKHSTDPLGWALDQVEDPLPGEGETPADAGRNLLLEALLLRIVGSGPEEDSLLAMAERTRHDFMALLEPATLTPREDKGQRVEAVDVLRAMALDPQAPVEARRWLWRRILVQLAPIAQEYATAPAPRAPEVPLQRHQDIVVGVEGAINPTRVKVARTRIEGTAPTGISAKGLQLAGIGGAVLLISIGWWVAGQPAWGMLFLGAGVLLGLLGFKMHKFTLDARARIADDLATLDSSIASTTKKLATAHQQAVETHQARLAHAARYQETQRRTSLPVEQ